MVTNNSVGTKYKDVHSNLHPYQETNAGTISNSYSTLHMDRFINSLGDETIVLTMNENSEYWLEEIAWDDRKKTFFMSHNSHSRLARSPFQL